MGIEIVTYILPEHVACYAMHGESSGDDDLESAYNAWLDDTIKQEGFRSMHLVSIEKDGFMRYHELQAYGIGSSDCDFFVYHVTRDK